MNAIFFHNDTVLLLYRYQKLLLNAINFSFSPLLNGKNALTPCYPLYAPLRSAPLKEATLKEIKNLLLSIKFTSLLQEEATLTLKLLLSIKENKENGKESSKEGKESSPPSPVKVVDERVKLATFSEYSLTFQDKIIEKVNSFNKETKTKALLPFPLSPKVFYASCVEVKGGGLEIEGKEWIKRREG